jgi:hypothetical protein
MMLLKSAISRTLKACLSSVDLPQLGSPMTGRRKIDVGNRRDVSRPEALHEVSTILRDRRALILERIERFELYLATRKLPS